MKRIIGEVNEFHVDIAKGIIHCVASGKIYKILFHKHINQKVCFHSDNTVAASLSKRHKQQRVYQSIKLDNDSEHKDFN